VNVGCCLGFFFPFGFDDGQGNPTLNGSYDVTDGGLSPLYSFTSGQPFSLSLSYAGEQAGDEGDGLSGVGSFSVSIAEVYVYDSNMDLISGYTLTAASGTIYPAVGDVSGLPEPSSIYLLVSVVLGAAWIARKRRTRAARAPR
jgi:hypothetical protein